MFANESDLPSADRRYLDFQTRSELHMVVSEVICGAPHKMTAIAIC